MNDTTFHKTLTFHAQSVDSEAIRALFGEPAPEGRPTFSLVYDTQHEGYGGPTYPTFRQGWRGLWDDLTGRTKKALREYNDELEAWVAAGRPTKTHTTRVVIPRATLS